MPFLILALVFASAAQLWALAAAFSAVLVLAVFGQVLTGAFHLTRNWHPSVALVFWILAGAGTVALVTQRYPLP